MGAEVNDIVDRPGGFIDFGIGIPNPSTYPMGQIQAALQSISLNDLGYVPNAGHTRLRETLCDWLMRYSGINVSPENILITNGSMDAIATLGSTLGAPGARLFVENPTYWRARELFSRFDRTVVPIDMRATGLDCDSFDKRAREAHAAGERGGMVYCTPNFHNPTGIVMAPEVRSQLLTIARRCDLFVVEDEAKAQLGFEIPPASLYSACEDDRVFSIGTLSKFVCPGLRIGWMAGPQDMIAELAARKSDGGTNPIASAVALALLESIDWDQRFQDLRRFYRVRFEAFWEAAACLPASLIRLTEPRGGFFVWARLAETIDLSRFDARCAAHRIAVLRGERAGAYEDHRGIRSSYANLDPDQISEGVARFNLVVEEASH